MMATPNARKRTPAKSAPQVPTRTRFFWGIGGFADCMIYGGINGLVDPIYNMAMGIDPRVIGLARSIPRLADIFIDPLIGHLSDNTRSRWGRRRPWMLTGALMAALIAGFMWYVPRSLGTGAANAFVVAMMVLLFTLGYSLFTIPYTGMGYGLTTDYNERTHLFKWRQYAYATAGFLTPWLPWMCVKLDIVLGDVSPGQASGLYGVRYVGILVGIVILLAAFAPIFCCSEGALPPSERSKVSFLSAIRFTLKNNAFWPLVIGNFLLKFGMSSTGIFFIYLLIYNVSGGDKQAGTSQWGIFCNVINVAAFLAMAPVAWLTGKIGKKSAMLLLMALSAAAYTSVWFTFRPHDSGWTAGVAGWLANAMGMPLSISNAWQIYITAAGIGIFCNCMPLILNSMVADVCDVDELNSGHQRQAFYGAVFVTCDKIAMGVAMLLQGCLLTASGFDSHVVIQKASTIAFWLKALLMSQPTGFILGFLIILAYPITRAKALEIRAQLDERR
ncbi:MAG TPA: MFS transporter [Verrucomicrobiae bacterium]|jgi:GPH family glycoside/pentoside/hexuronide:cation symporter